MRALALVLATVLGGGCRCGADPPGRESVPAHEPGPGPGSLTPPKPRTVVTMRPETKTAPSRPTAPVATPNPPRYGQPQPQPQPGFRLRGGHIDIDVHRTDVRQLLQSMARATGTNIVLHANVQGKVTVQLRNQPLRTAVEVVALAVGCRVRESGRMLIITGP